MYKSLIAAALLFSTGVSAKPSPVIPPIEESARQHFTLSQHDMTSARGYEYRIYVAVPKAPAPASGYPVLYMLDGNGQFPVAVNGYRSENGPAPLIIAVGYPTGVSYNTELRTRDYTPPAEGEAFAKGGQSEAFYQFIEQELKPSITAKYAVDASRQTLAGHSFGGLFTLYVLFNHPQSFQRYVAASPSLWWGKGVVIPKRSPLLTANPKSITMTVGEYEEKPDPTKSNRPVDPERAKRQAERQQVTKARDLAATLAQQGASVNFILFPGKNHGSVIPDAVNTAVAVAAQDK
ncbi:alpha/beta hydrolase [Leminorella grimontii]|uniref:alpha/beta hydrolase n=1 Tax=Leminorella grimontii TaxID=82981 RepID=UPI0020878EAC|nr:alpha/beta hydrolase-fold protein [Leminorella grimontii]GKX58017.1 esterase [Leminorella grimontii]